MTSYTEMAGYSRTQKLFHWVIAIVVIAMLALSFFLDDVPEIYKSQAFLIHKSLGLSILFLMILRFLLLMVQGRPALPSRMQAWEFVLSRIVQYGFYVLLIAMPIFGWIMSVAAGRTPTFFGLFALPLPIEPNKALSKLMFQYHQKIAYILIALIILHILGALKHHFIDKDNVLNHMLPRR